MDPQNKNYNLQEEFKENFLDAAKALKHYIKKQKMGVMYFLSDKYILDLSTGLYFSYNPEGSTEEEFKTSMQFSINSKPLLLQSFEKTNGSVLSGLQDFFNDSMLRGVVPVNEEGKNLLKGISNLEEILRLKEPNKNGFNYSIFNKPMNYY